MNASRDDVRLADPATRISELGDALERIRHEVLSPANIARATGHAISTISRDRATKPITDWSFREVMLCAIASPEIARSIENCLHGRSPDSGDALRVATDLVADVETTASVDLEIRRGLADGELRVREIDRIRTALLKRMASDLRLDKDLRAARRRARP